MKGQYVYYKNSLWRLAVYMRPSNFELLKESNPKTLVVIEWEGQQKTVQIYELESYSKVRNLNALKRR